MVQQQTEAFYEVLLHVFRLTLDRRRFWKKKFVCDGNVEAPDVTLS